MNTAIIAEGITSRRIPHLEGFEVLADSMTGAGARPGDIAYMDREAPWGPGDPVMVEIGHGEKKSFLFRWVIPYPDGTLELHPAAEGHPVLTFTMEQQERLGIHVAGPVVEVRWPPARRADRSLGNRALPDPS